ncbi:penicillin-binding protein 2 [Qipengyuania citrea]|jgi:penicillin-binding protein 2|uniref:Penicillin-binding protein 2 n=1 Tax=Qipengyuania citrea TaxID=225971 RepID=A0ABY4U8M4_9SPHN|nr:MULTISPECIES: penicillin-binding protein 2 [Erythrobacteraceae]MAB45576.1 penicillin-binding protein 2 [Sphingomonadaceae bacterium]MBL4896983.1 penicillin-binding protein 2 [Erythrobacter sp.]MEC7953303.1 penicillin-binding protein 2 [Pseudomonadota bacterium]QPL38798.1 penicillin-binding protein 2 [Erythrobacter sp. A30-3]MAQ66676.1 penicillin-binding protein 2 [Sphingomonadaceae bacterium]|tara:strand:- start:26648 stop:28705 length:2058 start_codon:yes stop_codon:yes gene_type:complete
MRLRKRAKPKEVVTQSTLDNAFDRRTFVIGTAMGGLGVLLAARMGYIAIAENEKYELESESNRVNLSLIPPRRGWILDRNGAPLASNRADFRVDIIPDRTPDTEATIAALTKILNLDENQAADIRKQVSDGPGYQPVEIASGITYDEFAAVSVRLPDLPGVVPQRGFSRFYPTGPSVGHLIGYVGTANAEEYAEQDRNPLLVTPGYKIGKDGLEKQYEQELRGVPGARRVEVTASGRIVRELETREDIQGDPIRLTIDGPLQDYAARRIGLESGSVVVMDCETGDLLCMASMPSFDPNSFSQGIGRVEYSMLRDDERVPLRNKVLKGLYPPGSTVKPMVSMAFMREGLDPDETVFCGGGLRVGNRVFRCWKRGGHGTVNMAKGIYQSCDVYYYHFAQRIGMDPIAAMAQRCGMGQEFPLPVASQFYGTVPYPAWKEEKYGRPWQAFDTVNATIGQGYMLANPLQLAVMSARLATGRHVQPRLVTSTPVKGFDEVDFAPEHVAYVRQAMSDVVNGPGTAGRARLPFDDIKMAGKTGTAQVVGLNLSDGKSGPWKYRDHGLFIFFAPFDKPKYAGAVVIEHGGGSGSAYPIARDVMTFLFDPEKGMEMLRGFEEQWGGTAQQRLDAKYRAYAAAAGEDVKPVPARDEEIFDQVEAEARLAVRRQESLADEKVDPRLDTSLSSGQASE